MHYFEVGKMDMFRELKLPYSREIPIVETHCNYRAPAHFDELLEIRSRFDDIREKSFKVTSEVYRVEDDNSFTLVGEGYTTHVYVDASKRPARLPDYYWEAFKKIENQE